MIDDKFLDDAGLLREDLQVLPHDVILAVVDEIGECRGCRSREITDLLSDYNINGFLNIGLLKYLVVAHL